MARCAVPARRAAIDRAASKNFYTPVVPQDDRPCTANGRVPTLRVERGAAAARRPYRWATPPGTVLHHPAKTGVFTDGGSITSIFSKFACAGPDITSPVV